MNTTFLLQKLCSSIKNCGISVKSFWDNFETIFGLNFLFTGPTPISGEGGHE